MSESYCFWCHDCVDVWEDRVVTFDSLFLARCSTDGLLWLSMLFLRVFSWLDCLFMSVLNSIPLAGCTIACSAQSQPSFGNFKQKCPWLPMFRCICLAVYFQLLEYMVMCAQLHIKPRLLFHCILSAPNELSPSFTSLSQNLMLPKLCSRLFPIDALWYLIVLPYTFPDDRWRPAFFMCSFGSGSFLSSLLKLHYIYG